MALVQTNALTASVGSSPPCSSDFDGAGAHESETSPRFRAEYRFVLRFFGAIAGLALLAVALRGLEPARALSRIRRVGPVAWLLFVPSILAVACETLAWQRAIGTMVERVRFSSLFRVRVASESLASILPLGALWAEAARPALLARRSSLSVGEGIASVAARKYLLVLSQSGYLLLAFVFGHTAVEWGFRRAAGVSGLSFVALGGATALLAVAEGSALAFRGGAPFRAIRRLVARFSRDDARTAALRDGTAQTDRAAVRFFALPWAQRLGLAAPCLAGWLLEATETWVFLSALGAGIGWTDALGVEAVVVLGRHLFVVLPGGLGVLELGYTTFFAASGTALDICGAFVVLKRLRELSWAAIGYLLWTTDRSAK